VFEIAIVRKKKKHKDEEKESAGIGCWIIIISAASRRLQPSSSFSPCGHSSTYHRTYHLAMPIRPMCYGFSLKKFGRKRKTDHPQSPENMFEED
jgi:hypothetical protein